MLYLFDVANNDGRIGEGAWDDTEVWLFCHAAMMRV